MPDFVEWSSWSDWMPVLTPAGVFLVTVAIGLMIRRFLLHRLEKWSQRTTSRVDDLVITSIRTPFLLWILMLGVYAAAQSSPLPDRAASLVNRILLTLWIGSLTLVAAKMSGLLMRQYGSRVDAAVPITGIGQTVLRVVVFTAGGLVLLNTLGVSITPVLTALGVGGLAVALALQDTLANFFAGFYLTLAGQVRVGHYIKLDSGEEGYVTDIGWRSTTIRMLANNLILVPNAKLGQAIVINYHLPETRMSAPTTVRVGYDSDIDHVERVLLEEAAELARQMPQMLSEPAPFVRFSNLGEWSIDLTVICQVREFVDQYLVQHELRRRIIKRFRREGITIPYPVRTLDIRRTSEGVTGNDFVPGTS